MAVHEDAYMLTACFTQQFCVYCFYTRSSRLIQAMKKQHEHFKLCGTWQDLRRWLAASKAKLSQDVLVVWFDSGRAGCAGCIRTSLALPHAGHVCVLGHSVPSIREIVVPESTKIAEYDVASAATDEVVSCRRLSAYSLYVT
jgi:hypothetical protein